MIEFAPGHLLYILTCDLWTYSARGTGEPQSGSHSYANLIKVVEATIPGGSNVEIQYTSSPEYFISPDTGAAAGASYLSSQLARCPNQKYVFVGYSKGVCPVFFFGNILSSRLYGS